MAESRGKCALNFKISKRDCSHFAQDDHGNEDAFRQLHLVHRVCLGEAAVRGQPPTAIRSTPNFK